MKSMKTARSLKCLRGRSYHRALTALLAAHCTGVDVLGNLRRSFQIWDPWIPLNDGRRCQIERCVLHFFPAWKAGSDSGRCGRKLDSIRECVASNAARWWNNLTNSPTSPIRNAEIVHMKWQSAGPGQHLPQMMICGSMAGGLGGSPRVLKAAEP
ncbi:uncharacterized protein EV422DRAFT_229920 [Fimicolochytrium jonesii]|uniref:uncharacterized protein n=1 Tax=Fimicolochytrium jonesii TaxID=1396493 RepID=UPI0022FEF572|nr:uncharacterized protein EV422DRAFT_229920 [Fimicolochytrium jonesii]KAI8817269.1 hypothetical protein EV422DRAFT_229920 [Fimicolochytrium jonesii]